MNPYAQLMRISIILVLVGLFLSPAAIAADINDLAWMTGRWAGAMGPATLEETWNQPLAGTMVAAVRMSGPTETGPAATSMVELITINEENDNLVLRLQQFSKTMEPRFPAQPLQMTSLGNKTVTFEAIGEGGLSKITYSRPENNTFNIEVTLTEGTNFVAPLSRVPE
jgi:hypothetical protein